MKDTVQLIPVGHPTGMDWQMSLNSGPKSQGKYPEIQVKYGDTDEISFKIDHPGAIVFADKNAFCAQAGTSKPTQCGGPFTVAGGGTTQLTVHDANTDKGETTYTYVLNFKNARSLDPIIKNGGGGGGVQFADNIGQILAIAVGVVVIALILWRALVARRAQDTTREL